MRTWGHPFTMGEMFDTHLWPRVIVIDGLPRSGKTALANLVAEKATAAGLRVNVVQSAAPLPFSIGTFVNFLMTGLQDGILNIISGFHVTSLAAAVNVPVSPKIAMQIWEVESLLDSLGAVKVFLHIPVDEWTRRNLGVKPSDEEIERWAAIATMFAKLANIEYFAQPASYLHVDNITRAQSDMIASAALTAIAVVDAQLDSGTMSIS